MDRVIGLPLEDGVGDIVRKAMDIRGMDGRALSVACGMEWGRIESVLRGAAALSEEVGCLAEGVGLDVDALVAIGEGWRPDPALVRVARVGMGGFPSPFLDWTVNAFVIWDEASRVAGVVDTGTEVGEMVGFLEDRGLDVRHLFLTHGHGDHTAGLDWLRMRFPGMDVWCGPGEHVDVPGIRIGREGDEVGIGRLGVRVVETPGHTAGGLTYVVEGWAENMGAVAFVGDLLFAGSVGRPNYSYDALMRSIVGKVLRLPRETVLACGHGPYTTVGEEMEHNPFVRSSRF